MRLPIPRVLLAIGLAALLGPAAAAPAATVRSLSLRDLVARADRIVVADVVEVRCERKFVRGDEVPVTLVTVRVSAVLEGAGANQIVLEFPGGRVGTDSLEIFDLPRFAVGDRDVLFLNAGPGHVSPLVGLMQGRFRIVSGEGQPRERVAAYDGRPLTPADLTGTGAPSHVRPDSAEGASLVTVATFERRILDLVRGTAHDSAPAATGVLGDGGLEPRARGESAPPAAALNVESKLGPSPALLDGCPDWACALGSREPFRRVTGASQAMFAGGIIRPPTVDGPRPTVDVSLAWGRSFFGYVIDRDTFALTVRRTNGDGARTTILLNDLLAWNSYEGVARSSPSGDVIDLPRVAVRELSLLASEGQEAANTPGAAASTIDRSAHRSASTRAASSREDLAPGFHELAASACDSSGAFVDPRWLTFNSPDHALMTGYQVGFFQPGAASPAQIVDLPLTAFMLRRVIDLPAWAVPAMQSALVADIRSAGLGTPIGIVYTYRVRGVWSGGTTAWSEGSQPFVRCTAAAGAAR